jgi:hypothetical protein
MVLMKKSEKVLNVFYRKKVMTKIELMDLLQCSGKTVQRRIKLWRALTSYNKNSRYYTLPEIVVFDSYGIWHYKDISFSQYGNLDETVIQLVHTADAGLTGRELGNILGLEPRSFLSHFRGNPKLYRIKCNARFVYFSGEIKRQEKQIEVRQEQEEIIAGQFPTSTQAVMILVELIKHPALSSAELAKGLCKQGMKITSSAIEQLLIHHGLIKKNPNQL